ncbi:metallo-beta-lactamase superfamily protein [Hokovirus HKV1]|uniref:Metallo-beta-lactamase superfamily protein n=1 Tax=Hokovirus HKV1 TaxID=1977638 RepID=A0A1V0SGC6_9VIRU|nr:metallo-beta-lactamase superfamily protein [Hokovirus HKV1]
MATNSLIFDNLCNLACCDHNDERIHSDLANHSETFKQGIYKINQIFYLAVGYGLSNITMIEGNDGIIIIDTGESFDVASKVFADFSKITNKPVKCIIYTHNHFDHIAGVKAFTTKEDVENGNVKIYAHRKIMAGIINNASVVGPIINARGISTFGLVLETNASGHINDGIGPRLKPGKATFIHPTDFVDTELDINICNINMRLVYAPSETDDEIFIYFPDHSVIQSADIIMGESYPNLYSIRGTPNRDPIKWYESIDLMRKLKPDYLIPSHGRPLEGKEKVYNMLTAYRDAIQYTHDQSVRWINKGYNADELAEVIPHLPENLNHPWLQEYYGTVKHSVRQIYAGYLGWFQGDPTFLDPENNKIRARNYIEGFGGRSKVLSIACSSIDEGNYKWAAEILTYLVTFNINDQIARSLKANCLRQLAYKTKNTNWRNWYLTSAKELDNTIDYKLINNAHGCDSQDIIAEIPIPIFLKSLCTKLMAEKSLNTYITMGFNILPKNITYYLEIRSCIVEFHDQSVDKVDYIINIEENTLRNIFLRNTTALEEIKKGNLTFGKGTNLEGMQSFFDYFDIKNVVTTPKLALPHL